MVPQAFPHPSDHPLPPLELWGGMESTVNRVNDTFFDQLTLSGHLGRIPADLERFAGLGLQTLRYPFHWERFAAAGSWQPFDEAISSMNRLGIKPIAGLVHHGSGPIGTDLLDPGFAPRLADYALAFARRYPEITRYTPVNEPQTTARFSGLYGHWYPHHRTVRSYVHALVHQLRASALSMRAIRTVTPAAQFIHTEDGGKTFSTARLETDRLFREHRRWLGVDLLCGRVDEHHPLYRFLLDNGISQTEILWFAEHPCPPDVLGLNYYLTSDRFLDHRTELYPPSYAGGDTGHERFVDIEALRVYPGGIAGVGTILTEAWQRFGIPVAITEAHIAGPVEDQILWLGQIWNEALDIRSAGVPCLAITVWALLGSYNWSNLVTRDTGVYEPGVFSLDNPAHLPQPTGLAPFVEQLARQGTVPPQPVTAIQWWREPDRLTFPPEILAEAPDLLAEVEPV